MGTRETRFGKWIDEHKAACGLDLDKELVGRIHERLSVARELRLVIQNLSRLRGGLPAGTSLFFGDGRKLKGESAALAAALGVSEEELRDVWRRSAVRTVVLDPRLGETVLRYFEGRGRELAGAVEFVFPALGAEPVAKDEPSGTAVALRDAAASSWR